MTNRQTDEFDTTNSNSLLKACCEREHLLIGNIQDLLREKLGSNTRRLMLLHLNRMILNLPNLLELSSEEGYLSVVLERRPNWSLRVNQLYHANLHCVSTLTFVRDSLQNDAPAVVISKGLEERLRNWLKSFSAMRRLESNMLQEALTLDLGGEA